LVDLNLSITDKTELQRDSLLIFVHLVKGNQKHWLHNQQHY